MPTVLRVRGFRFFFYSGDRDEPPHVHDERDGDTAKVWLSPVRLERSQGFNSRELNELQGMVDDHRDALLERWREFFGEE